MGCLINSKIKSKMLANHRSPKETFRKHLLYIRKGMTSLERAATELAEEHGFSRETLNSALKKGHTLEFKRYKAFLEDGLPQFYDEARKFALKYGFSVKALNDAEKKGKEGLKIRRERELAERAVLQNGDYWRSEDGIVFYAEVPREESYAC